MKRKHQWVSVDRSFATLGEALFTMGVITVLLTALVTVVVVNSSHRSYPNYRGKVEADFSALKQAIRMFKIDNKRYPTSLAELMTVNSNGKGPWIEEMANDPWGNPYIYNYETDGTYDVISYGADGKPGGDEYGHDYNLGYFQQDKSKQR